MGGAVRMGGVPSDTLLDRRWWVRSSLPSWPLRAVAVFVAGALLLLVVGFERAGADPGASLPPVVSSIAITNLIAGVPAAVTIVDDGTYTSRTCQWQTAGKALTPGSWADVAGATNCTSYAAPSGDNAKWHRLAVTEANAAGSAQYVSRAYRLGGEVLGSSGGIKYALADGTKLAVPMPDEAAGGASYEWPDLSPDGSLIALQRRQTGGAPGDVWLVDASGSWARQLTATPEEESGPRWSPDGSKLAYLRYVSGSGPKTVIVLDVTTGIETGYGPYDNVILGNLNGLEWTDDSNLLLYAHSRNGGLMEGARWRYYTGWPALGTGRTTDPSVTCPYTLGGQKCQFLTEAWKLTLGGAIVQVTDSVPPTNSSEYATLTAYKTTAVDPRVSPSGVTLVSSNNGNGLMIKTTPGTWAQEYTTFASSGYAWRSDGTKIFWSKYAAGSASGVYTVNPDLTGSAAYATGATFTVTDFGFANPAGHPFIPPVQTYGPPGGGGPIVNPSGAQAEPVNTATGSYFTQVTDVSLPGVGVPFAFVRTYNSADATAGVLGAGWTHSYAAGLSVAGNGDVTVRWGTGQQALFRRNADGSYRPPAGALSTLTSVSGGYELLLRRGQIRYGFDAQGRLTSIEDRNDNTVALTYTGGLLTQITDTVGRQIALTYQNGLLSSVTVPDGRHVDYGYTTGRLTSVVDVRGKTWAYEYDANGRLTKITDPNGHFVVRNTYGSSGRVTDQYDARNYHTTFAWDANTQTATMTDARGKQWKDVYRGNVLWKRIDPLQNTIVLFHDEAHNLAKIVDPRGNATRMSYTAGNLTTRKAPTPLSYLETWTYTSRNDVATYKDGRGGITSFGYDTAGNLTQVTYPDPDGAGPLAAPVEQFGRDPEGTGLLVSYTDPRSKTTTLQYANGLPTQVVSPLGNTTTYGYDAAGRVTSVVDPRGHAAGANPADYTTSFTYDAAGNTLTVTAPDPDGAGGQNAATWSATYDDAGLPDTATDPRGNVTAYDYDAADNLTQVTAPDPDGGGPLAAPVTQYAYNEVGDLSSRTDANQHVTSYGYDDARRLVTTTAPLARVWSYGYDANANLVSITNANGNATPAGGDGITTYTYDNLDRLTAINYSDTTPDVGYAYDANSNRTQMTDGFGTETRAFDALDRLTQVTRGSDSFVYSYDAASNLTKRTYPGSVVSDLAYDDDGRLQTVTSAGATTGYGYDEAGNLLTTTLPAGNGHLEQRVYDRAGRLVEVWNKKGAVTLSRFQVTRDLSGNPTFVVRSGGMAETRGYVYDGLDRLLEVCYQASPCNGGSDLFIRWAYDAVGNRLSESRPAGTTVYSYDAADRLQSAGATGYGFDANGNQTAAGSRTFAYDLANRVKSTTLSGTTTTFGYDGDGKRLQTTAGSATTNWLWDVSMALPQLAVERDGGGMLLRRYQYGADLISMVAPSNVFYLHRDDLGSITDVTAADGTPQWRYGYDPYGTLTTQTQLDPAAPANTLGFAGEHHDATGLVHLRARQYDPATGRFLTTDPISSWPSAESAYAYVGNQPTILIDPSGLAGQHADQGTCGSWARRIPFIGDEWCTGFSTLNPTTQGLVGAYLDTAPEALAMLVPGAVGVRLVRSDRLGYRGREIWFGRNGNVRVAPIGNKPGQQYGRVPHYHRRGPIDPTTGRTAEGQGLRRHRPWQTKSNDTSVWDRF